MKNFFKNKHIYLLLIFSLISVFSYSQDQLIRILEDSLTVLGKKYASVGYVKIKKITSKFPTSFPFPIPQLRCLQ